MTDSAGGSAAGPVPAGADALRAQAQAWLDDLFAPWVKALRLSPERVVPGEAVLRLPFDERLCREGGTICGQALMAAADTAMVIAVASHAGGFRPMTTVSQNTSFMRAVSGGDVIVTARVLKPGRTLTFGEIELASASDGKLAAHVTTTYALL